MYTGTYPLQILPITFCVLTFSTCLDGFSCFFFFGDIKSRSSFFFNHHNQQESYFLTSKGQDQGQYCFAHAQMPLISIDKQDIWVCYRVYTQSDTHNSVGVSPRNYEYH